MLTITVKLSIYQCSVYPTQSNAITVAKNVQRFPKSIAEVTLEDQQTIVGEGFSSSFGRNCLCKFVDREVCGLSTATGRLFWGKKRLFLCESVRTVIGTKKSSVIFQRYKNTKIPSTTGKKCIALYLYNSGYVRCGM